MVKKIAKYCFLRKTNSFRNLRKYSSNFLNFKMKNKILLTKKFKKLKI